MTERTALKLLCLINLHRWQYVEDIWGSFGMGLEKFEVFKCRRCGVHTDRLKDDRHNLDRAKMLYRWWKKP
jgi:hypothetical protein